MSKHNKNREAVEAVAVDTMPVQADQATTPQNFTLFRHRADHPGNRSSYTIPGVPGNVVFFNSLFANGKAPETITLNVQLVNPQTDKKTEREAQAAQKAAERAMKAAQKLEAQQAKAAERKAKLEAQMAAAKAKLTEQTAAAAAVGAVTEVVANAQ